MRKTAFTVRLVILKIRPRILTGLYRRAEEDQIIPTCSNGANLTKLCVVVAFLAVGIFLGMSFSYIGKAGDSLQAYSFANRSYMNVGPSGGFAGDFLSGHFAQSQHDWDTASIYLERTLAYDPQNLELLERSMILSAGSGNIDVAAKRAEETIAAGGDKGLPLIIMTVHAFLQDDFKRAERYLAEFPGGDVASFIKPLLFGWAKAAQGLTKEEIYKEEFLDISVHAFHGVLIALYIGDKDTAKNYVDKMMQLGGLSEFEGERLADLLVLSGEYDSALGLYKGLQIHDNNAQIHDEISDARLDKKIAAINGKGPGLEKLITSLKITSPVNGVAWVMHDMASILYQEHNDVSTNLFSNLALILKPDLIESIVFLANIAERNGRNNDAIDHYMAVPKEHDLYLNSRRKAAFLMAKQGDLDRAKVILNDLFENHDDLNSLIQLGDVYRQRENYSEALRYYNRAAKYLKNDIAEDNWYLLYVRGMVYEREGQWVKAEADLQAALGYRPDHPFLLNYLGYGWADQGANLKKSLELIEKAVSIRPKNGYIRDSLGWVHYMMGNCEHALPHLERAVEFIPYDAVIDDHLGDVYWCLGRKQEARFQWERALNNTEDQELSKLLSEKIKRGLANIRNVRKAHK